MGRDLLCVFNDEKKVRGMTPDMDKVRRLPVFLCMSRQNARMKVLTAFPARSYTFNIRFAI